MNVLVTGALGLVGRRSVVQLAKAGHSVVAFDLPSARNRRVARHLATTLDRPAHSPGRRTGKLSFRFGDIRDHRLVAELVAGQDAVLHLAGLLPPATERSPEIARAVNLGGTLHLVDAARRQPLPPKLAFASSVTVYGLSERPTGRPSGDVPLESRAWSRSTAAEAGRPSAESVSIVGPHTPTRPCDTYSRLKIEAERLVRESGLTWSILRVGVVLDPYVLQGGLDELRLLSGVDPRCALETVDAGNVALAQARLLESDEAWNRVLLIGGGARSQICFADLFEATLGPFGLWPLPPGTFGDGPYYTHWMDTRESEALLAYQRLGFDDFRRAYQRSHAALSGWLSRLGVLTRPLVARLLRG